MADQKISAMPSASTLDGTELVPLVQSGANVQSTVSDINAFTTNRISLISSTTQTALANTATIVTFDTTAFSQNISLVDSSKITFAVAGAYVLNFSFQMSNSDTQIHTADFWVRLNGTNYALTNTKLDIPSSHGGIPGHIVASWSIPGIAAANDYVEIVWSTTSANVIVEYTGPDTSPTRPATPSVIAAVWQVG